MSLSSISGFSPAQLFSPVPAGPKKAASAVATLLNTQPSATPTTATTTSNTFSAASPQTAYDAQAIGQSEASTPTADAASGTQEKESATDAFLKFAKMTPEQKIRALFLASEGLTEKDLAAMSPKDRQKIEDKIQKKIEDALKRGTGMDLS